MTAQELRAKRKEIFEKRFEQALYVRKFGEPSPDLKEEIEKLTKDYDISKSKRGRDRI